MLMTPAPLSVAHRTAAAMSALEPTPLTRPSTMRTMRVRALTGSRRQFHVTPATPTPLFDTAAMVPDTWVPWPTSSSGDGSRPEKSPSKREPAGGVGAGPRSTMSKPGSSSGASSGWLRSTPLSITPTTTLGSPVVRSHAAGALIRVRPHWRVKSGSFGIAYVSR
jgi:hypothetical protein